MHQYVSMFSLSHTTHTCNYRELLDEIARFEERELNISPTHSFSQSRKQLEPVNASGGEKLLNLVSFPSLFHFSHTIFLCCFFFRKSVV